MNQVMQDNVVGRCDEDEKEDVKKQHIFDIKETPVRHTDAVSMLFDILSQTAFNGQTIRDSQIHSKRMESESLLGETPDGALLTREAVGNEFAMSAQEAVSEGARGALKKSMSTKTKSHYEVGLEPDFNHVRENGVEDEDEEEDPSALLEDQELSSSHAKNDKTEEDDDEHKGEQLDVLHTYEGSLGMNVEHLYSFHPKVRAVYYSNDVDNDEYDYDYFLMYQIKKHNADLGAQKGPLRVFLGSLFASKEKHASVDQSLSEASPLLVEDSDSQLSDPPGSFVETEPKKQPQPDFPASSDQNNTTKTSEPFWFVNKLNQIVAPIRQTQIMVCYVIQHGAPPEAVVDWDAVNDSTYTSNGFPLAPLSETNDLEELNFMGMSLEIDYHLDPVTDDSAFSYYNLERRKEKQCPCLVVKWGKECYVCSKEVDVVNEQYLDCDSCRKKVHLSCRTPNENMQQQQLDSERDEDEELESDDTDCEFECEFCSDDTPDEKKRQIRAQSLHRINKRHTLRHRYSPDNRERNFLYGMTIDVIDPSLGQDQVPEKWNVLYTGNRYPLPFSESKFTIWADFFLCPCYLSVLVPAGVDVKDIVNDPQFFSWGKWTYAVLDASCAFVYKITESDISILGQHSELSTLDVTPHELQIEHEEQEEEEKEEEKDEQQGQAQEVAAETRRKNFVQLAFSCDRSKMPAYQAFDIDMCTREFEESVVVHPHDPQYCYDRTVGLFPLVARGNISDDFEEPINTTNYWMNQQQPQHQQQEPERLPLFSTMTCSEKEWSERVLSCSNSKYHSTPRQGGLGCRYFSYEFQCVLCGLDDEQVRSELNIRCESCLAKVHVTSCVPEKTVAILKIYQFKLCVICISQQTVRIHARDIDPDLSYWKRRQGLVMQLSHYFEGNFHDSKNGIARVYSKYFNIDGKSMYGRDVTLKEWMPDKPASDEFLNACVVFSPRSIPVANSCSKEAFVYLQRHICPCNFGVCILKDDSEVTNSIIKDIQEGIKSKPVPLDFYVEHPERYAFFFRGSKDNDTVTRLPHLPLQFYFHYNWPYSNQISLRNACSINVRLRGSEFTDSDGTLVLPTIPFLRFCHVICDYFHGQTLFSGRTLTHLRLVLRQTTSYRILPKKTKELIWTALAPIVYNAFLAFMPV